VIQKLAAKRKENNKTATGKARTKDAAHLTTREFRQRSAGTNAPRCCSAYQRSSCMFLINMLENSWCVSLIDRSTT